MKEESKVPRIIGLRTGVPEPRGQSPFAQIVRGQHGGSTGAARGQEVTLFTRTALQNTRAVDMNLH